MESLPYLFASMYSDLENSAAMCGAGKNILTSKLSAECIIWWKNLTEDIRSDYIYNIKKY
jgi:hypothetical protein